MRGFRLPVADLTTGQLAGYEPLIGGTGCVTWHSTIETTGSAAAHYFLFNDSGLIQELMNVSLSEGQSTRDYIGLHALAFTGGLWLYNDIGLIDGVFAGYTDHVCEDVLSAHAAILQIEGAAALKALGALGGP